MQHEQCRILVFSVVRAAPAAYFRSQHLRNTRNEPTQIRPRWEMRWKSMTIQDKNAFDGLALIWSSLGCRFNRITRKANKCTEFSTWKYSLFGFLLWTMCWFVWFVWFVWSHQTSQRCISSGFTTTNLFVVCLFCMGQNLSHSIWFIACGSIAPSIRKSQSVCVTNTHFVYYSFYIEIKMSVKTEYGKWLRVYLSSDSVERRTNIWLRPQYIFHEIFSHYYSSSPPLSLLFFW